MPLTDTPKLPTSWSPSMLNEFHQLINSPLPISFSILEKNKSTTFLGKYSTTSFRSRKTSHVSYRGNLPIPGLENIIVMVHPVTSLLEEFRHFIGYIEIVNGYKEDNIPIPEIRCFIQEDSGICEIFNEMLMESKMFNSRMSPVYIYLEQAYCLKDKNPEELLKKKIPIKEISTFQKISCTE